MSDFFKQLDLHPDVLKGIEQMGFTSPMPIQEKTLPLTVKGESVIGQAQTGSGKTAAFLVAALHRLCSNPSPTRTNDTNPRVLVMAPTRELVQQISDNAEQLAAPTGLRLHTVLGGVDYEKQRDAFADGVDILIGTPGRLIDYYKQKVYSLSDLEILIVDECDRMFDMGFIDDVRWLVRKMPPAGKRQNLLFSATVDYRVSELAWEHMDKPDVIAVDRNDTPPDKIQQSVYHLALTEKMPFLIKKIRDWHAEGETPRIIVFTNRRYSCLRVSDYLVANDIPALALSGALSQQQRFKALNAFKEEKPPVIVATDVASRGLHIDDVTHVVNWDVPENPKDYIHRIGRTARAGAEGQAVVLASEDTVEYLPKVEETVGKAIDVVWAETEEFIEIRHPKRRPPEKKFGGPGRGGPNRGGPGRGGPGRGGPNQNRNRRSGSSNRRGRS